jgi:aminoglycoside 3-N-acetyltransferase
MRARDDVSGPGPVGPVVTHGQLVSDFQKLGVEAGETLLVHASLSSVGWVDGGANTVVRALRELVGPNGNLVVPASTEANSMTSRAHRERIAHMTPEQVGKYRTEMPAFDKDTTESGAGAIAEVVRKSVGAVRSAHPQSSFAAVGPEAEYLMADHALESHLGEALQDGRAGADDRRLLPDLYRISSGRVPIPARPTHAGLRVCRLHRR